MTLSLVLDTLAAICMIGGALMSVAAAVGLVRFPDLLSRMHSATKPQVLGLLLMLTALALMVRSWAVVPVLLLAWLFQLLTAPVSAHMVGRAGYRTKRMRKELLRMDELDEVVEAAARNRDAEYRAAPEAGEPPEDAVTDPSGENPVPEDAREPSRVPESDEERPGGASG